jgi:hypothetical protein
LKPEIDLITIKINGRKAISIESRPGGQSTVNDHAGIHGQQGRCGHPAKRNCETEVSVLQVAAAALQPEKAQGINNTGMRGQMHEVLQLQRRRRHKE